MSGTWTSLPVLVFIKSLWLNPSKRRSFSQTPRECVWLKISPWWESIFVMEGEISKEDHEVGHDVV